MSKYLLLVMFALTACNKQDEVLDMSPIDAKGHIIFLGNRITNTADLQLLIMNADGTGEKLISNKLVSYGAPVLSHNGKKLLFTSYENNLCHLYVMDIDGQNQLLLSTATRNCGMPCWSADDNKIAFVKNPLPAEDAWQIYIINADGSNEKQLTVDNMNYSPQFSPDNKLIIFTAGKDNWSGIYTMNIDGSNKQLITPAGKSFGMPKFSPDGKKIVVTSGDRNGSQIFVMNENGSHLTQLTFTVSPNYYDVGFPRDGNNSPAWSPNSEQLAYVSYENGSPDIFVMNTDGTHKKRLTDTPLRDENPVWTSDGNYILFTSNRKPNNAAQVYIMRTKGQLQTQLTNYPGNSILPIYTP